VDQAELLIYLLDALHRVKLRYAIVGSHATIAYGEQRLTNDIDVLIDLDLTTLQTFCREFPPPRFYVSEERAKTAAAKGGTFNIIDPEGGQKIDVFVPASAFDRTQFDRVVKLPIGQNREAQFVSPEDVIIKKMEYYREGGSEKHLRDIAAVLKILGDKVNRQQVEDASIELGLKQVWDLILDRIK
jgi:hypothetical protein